MVAFGTYSSGASLHTDSVRETLTILRLVEQQTHVPVLPVISIERLVSTIKTFILDTTTIDTSSSEIQEMNVLPWATTTAPRKLLTAQEVDTILQLCGSLEGLEKATRMRDGKQHLANSLGPEVARAVCEFWDDEWIA